MTTPAKHLTATLVTFVVLLSVFVAVRARGTSQEELEQNHILELVIRDLMLRPGFHPDQYVHGMPDGRSLALCSDSPVPWPKSFEPQLPSIWSVSRIRCADFNPSSNPRLAIELWKFDLSQNPDESSLLWNEEDAHILVAIFNAGGQGRPNHVSSSAMVFGYMVRRHGSSITIELVSQSA